jgi:hypothetical protein
MGLKEESESAANAGLFRLRGFREKLGDDYRLDHAEASLIGLKSSDPDEVRAAVQKANASRPADVIEEFRKQYQHARTFAMAGMVSDAINILEQQFNPPSEISVHWLDLDPAFNGIREEPEFIAMLERHR